MRRFRALGGSIHPFYRSILLRAVNAGFELPSTDCQRLQNTLVAALAIGGVWARLDYFYPLATHGLTTATLGFAGINWIQPNNPLSNVSAAVNVNKKGIYGALQYGFNFNTMSVMQAPYGGTPSNYYEQGGCMFCMLGVAGGTPVTVEGAIAIQGTTPPANENWQTIRFRTVPRVDYLMNSETGVPGELQAGIPVVQRIYGIDRVNRLSDSQIRNTGWWGGVQKWHTSAGSMGYPMASPNLQTGSPINSNLPSTRALALVGGGASLFAPAYTAGLYTVLDTAVQNYFNALQTLP